MTIRYILHLMTAAALAASITRMSWRGMYFEIGLSEPDQRRVICALLIIAGTALSK